MKVYFISGLAADSRVFKNIVLPDGCETVHLDWIKPFKNESLETYSTRLAEKIIRGEQFALVGLSMGGMIASEIASQFDIAEKHKPAITILLSSIPVHSDMPAHFKIAGFLKLYRLMPTRALKSASFLRRFFSTTNENNSLLMQLIKESDPKFIKWAIPAILHWKNEKLPKPLLHIHGTKDRVLPSRYTKPTHYINGGSHAMVVDRAPELNKLIQEALMSIQQ